MKFERFELSFGLETSRCTHLVQSIYFNNFLSISLPLSLIMKKMKQSRYVLSLSLSLAHYCSELASLIASKEIATTDDETRDSGNGINVFF